MNSKYLAVLPLIVIGVLGWFFWSKNTPKPAVSLGKPSIQSQIQSIKAVQTNPDTGEIEYTLTAESLTQNTDGQSELLNVTMDWTPDTLTSYLITAKRAMFDQTTGDFEFGGGFELRRSTKNSPAQDTLMTLTGDTLMGNTKDKVIASHLPLTVKEAGNSFYASAMTADLKSKDYQFLGIKTTFTPPARQDKALF